MTPDQPDRSTSDRLARRRRAALAGHEADARTARALRVDDDPSVRATALGASARAGDLTADDVGAAADDADATVRRRAAELLATPAGADLPVSLLGLLGDDDASVVEVAAWAAGERHEEGRAAGPDAVDTVVGRLIALSADHDDALVREAAVAALGAIGAPAGLPAILRALADKVTIRRRAVIALAPFDGLEVSEALQRAATDRDWQVRQSAEDQLEP